MKETCTVHLLDPYGDRSELWPIGDDGVPTDVYEKFKDDEGDVYAIVVYGDGEPETSFIKKQIWKQAEQQLAEIERDRPSIFRRCS